MDDVSVVVRKVWGTWEDLILGGAVLRHGTGDWDVISSELRTRTAYPYYFTPEACRCRYEDLQQRYTGCKYWYDELRERRVAELKQALEKSQASIGFLVSKLENLKGEKDPDQIDYDSSQTESPLPKTTVLNIKTIHKEVELSATQDLGTTQQPESSQNIHKSCMMSVSEEISNGTLRKRRGKRKRKDGNWDLNQGGFVETRNLGCDLVEIFNSVTENQFALVFRRRLDSQKRARYRKTIRQHMDLDTIKSRIANCCIKSTKELFRDLLLIANNALVFYSKRTREYKSALTLRGIITEKYNQLCTSNPNSSSSSSSTNPLSSILCFSSMSCPPVRPRSVRPRAPCKQPKLVVKIPGGGPVAGPHGYLKLSSNSDSSTVNLEIDGGKKSNVDFSKKSNVDVKNVKRGLGRPRRGGGGGGRGGKQPPSTPSPRNCTNRKKVHQK